ncbi:MAG: response regulator [Chitinispirillaceae bacterium]|nr:response regulator [Chitinispirillaceae bacterium]
MCRILIVDDEEVVLFAFKKGLSGPSITVDTAPTFKDAWRLIQYKSYCAIITDLRLSGSELREGLEVIRETRRIQTECKIIAITGYGGDDTRERVFKLGADKYLEKPVSPEKIGEMLQAMGALPSQGTLMSSNGTVSP